MSIGSAVGKIALLVVITFFVGKRWLPEFLGWVAATRSRELFTLSVLAVALGIGVGSAVLFGASMALGAFLAGMIVNQSAYSHRAAIEALPMRDAFAVLFFVSVGMLFNPWNFNQEWWMIALTCLVILIGKPIAALLVVRMLNYPVHVGLSVAIALSQIGEFSFILASLGKELKILPGIAVDVLVASSMISITLNPVLYRLARPTAKLIGRNRVLRWLLEPVASARGAEQRYQEKGITPRQRAIVIGYGPIGRLVVRLLLENEIEPTIVELNPKTVQNLCAQGIRAIYGDASHIETLRVAGLERTKNLILTASELSGAVELIRAARDVESKGSHRCPDSSFGDKKIAPGRRRRPSFLCRRRDGSVDHRVPPSISGRKSRTIGGEPRFDPEDSLKSCKDNFWVSAKQRKKTTAHSRCHKMSQSYRSTVKSFRPHDGHRFPKRSHLSAIFCRTAPECRPRVRRKAHRRPIR